MRIHRPAATEYNHAFEAYVSRVQEDDVLPILDAQPGELRTALGGLAEAREGFRYAPDKWSIKEVVGHLIDSGRVFGYRAVSIARGETASLPGFEENDYAANAGHDRYRLSDLLTEFEALRTSHVSMLSHLDQEGVGRIGTANEHPLSVRAIAYVMAGHLRHHLGVLTTRYGPLGA